MEKIAEMQAEEYGTTAEEIMVVGKETPMHRCLAGRGGEAG